MLQAWDLPHAPLAAPRAEEDWRRYRSVLARGNLEKVYGMHSPAQKPSVHGFLVNFCHHGYPAAGVLGMPDGL